MPTCNLNDEKINCVTVVLVGGQGTRIRHLLPDLPKPLAPVFGYPFLEWILRFLSKQRSHRVILSTGYMAEKIKYFIESRKSQELNISCVEEKIPLGTAGGVLNALDELGEGFEAVLVLNGDSLVLTDLAPLLNVFQDQSIDAVILGVRVGDALRYGTLKFGNNRLLVGFKEKKPGAGVINAGVYLFRRKILDSLPRGKVLSFEVDVFPKLLLENKRIKIVEVEAPFIDIGTEETLTKADAFIRKNSSLLR